MNSTGLARQNALEAVCARGDLNTDNVGVRWWHQVRGIRYP
jgi:hypothetical protein